LPEVALTRRELRELERRTGQAAEAVPPAQPVAPVELTPVELTPAAGILVAAELHEPDLEPAFLAESDRVVAAPPVADSPATPFELLLSDVPTTTTEITLPRRSRVRAEEPAAPARPRRPVAAARRLAPPRPTPAPARAAEPASAHMRAFAAKGFSIAAMAFVALMAVSTSLPAEALLSSADVQAAALAASRPNDSGPAQSLDLAGGTDTITVERDGYDSQTIAEVAAASGIRLEATFTNDPNGTIQWPFAVGVHIGSRFGIRHCAGCSVNHQGQDFNPGIGAPIQAIADGVVSEAIDGEGSLGVHMVIDHMINGKLVSSAYAHMIHGSMLFKVGDVVKVGQVIGKTGNTGMSTGPHLHFEIRLGGLNGVHVDPLVWLYANTN
jgi:murein DD-endopeptidase MepM/ murein hydrolase activator NlpD